MDSGAFKKLFLGQQSSRLMREIDFNPLYPLLKQFGEILCIEELLVVGISRTLRGRVTHLIAYRIYLLGW